MIPLLLVAGTAACSDSGQGARVTVEDSAGVEIVTNAGAGAWAAGGGRRLPDRPVVEIGSVRGPAAYQLHRVTDAARLSDGTIVVADGGSGELRFFDAEGRHVGTAGGSGGGPAEFRQLAAVEVTTADSVLAFDARTTRVSVFDAEGSFGRAVSLEGDVTGLSPVGWLDDGTFVAEESTVPSAREPSGEGLFSYRTASTFHLYDRGGGHLRELVSLPGDVETAMLSTSGGGDFRIRTAAVPFLRKLRADVGDRMLVLSATDRGAVRYYSAGGTLVRIVRDEMRAPRALKDEHVASWIDERVGDDGAASDRRRLREQLEQLPLDPHLPRFEALLLGKDDRLWVREYRPPGSGPGPATWTAYDDRGRRLGTLEMPSRFEPFEIAGSRVLGLWTSELDVQTVRLYRIVDREDR